MEISVVITKIIWQMTARANFTASGTKGSVGNYGKRGKFYNLKVTG